MRVLLDEQLPRELAVELTGHETRTIDRMGWKGLGNGELLAQAAGKFDVLLTMDKAMPLEHDIARYRIALVLLRAKSNRIEDLRPLAPEILRAVAGSRPGAIVRVGA
ncbi:MAG: hypothetical protein ACHQ1G_10430 [Planctomycetota bacterium]